MYCKTGRGEGNEGGRWGRGGRLKMDERVGEGERGFGVGRGGDLDDRARGNSRRMLGP